MAKFCWGDEAFTIPLMLVAQVVSAIAIGVTLCYTGPAQPVAGETGVNSLVVLTCVFAVVWYIFLGNQVGIKFTEGLSPEVSEKAAFVATRVVQNTLEQAIPFLALLWMEGLLVNSRTATILGWIYVVTRFLYAPLYAFYGQFTVLIELSTQPNYVVITYFLVTVFFKCACGIDLHAKMEETGSWVVILFVLACSFGYFIAFLVLAKPTTGIMIAGAKKACGKEDLAEE